MLKKFIVIIIIAAMLQGCAEKKPHLTREELREKYIAEQHPCPYKKIERLTLDEALKVYEYYKRNKKNLQLIMTIERIMALSADHALLEPMLREVGDLYYLQEDYKKAEEHYASYVQLYPGSAHIDYVQKRLIEASFNQKANAQRDQKKTKDTIQLARNFLADFPIKNQYRARVQEILEECYFVMMESELNRVLFYINRHNTISNQQKALEAGWQRLADLNRDILTNIQDQCIHVMQEKIRNMLNQPIEHRTIENLEKLTEPLQLYIREKKGIWYWL